jgi:asparagine N-glycosylation enzyme membrane subunit Stt3
MTDPTSINEAELFPRLVRGSLILSFVLAVVTALAVSPRFGASLFAGGILATANFIWLRRGLEAVLQLNPSTASRFATLRFLLRLSIMAAALYLLIVVLGADIFGILLGLSMLVINIIILSIYLSTRKGG